MSTISPKNDKLLLITIYFWVHCLSGHTALRVMRIVDLVINGYVVARIQ